AHPLVSKEFFVVAAQFVIQTRVGYVGQFHFTFARSRRHAAAFADVAHAAARGLHHLIGHPAVLWIEPPAKHYRGIVHRLRHLVAPELLVTAMRQQNGLSVRRFHRWQSTQEPRSQTSPL